MPVVREQRGSMKNDMAVLLGTGVAAAFLLAHKKPAGAAVARTADGLPPVYVGSPGSPLHRVDGYQTEEEYAGLAGYRSGYNVPAGFGFIDPVTAAAALKGAQQLASMFGIGGGGAEDKRRMDRAAWLLDQAIRGNVAAAQSLLGGMQQVASHEKPYYEQALSSLRGTPDGATTLHEAEIAGPYWTGEPSTDWNRQRSFVTSWALSNQPIATVARAVGNAAGGATGGVPNVAWLAAGVGALFLLMPKGRRS